LISLLAVTAAPALSAPGGSYIRIDERYLYAGNDRVELVFQKNDGRLYSLVDKSSNVDFLVRKAPSGAFSISG